MAALEQQKDKELAGLRGSMKELQQTRAQRTPRDTVVSRDDPEELRDRDEARTVRLPCPGFNLT